MECDTIFQTRSRDWRTSAMLVVEHKMAKNTILFPIYKFSANLCTILLQYLVLH